MGRPPCCDKSNVKRGLWTPEEDAKILAYVSAHGTGNWTLVPKKAGLNRCGKSCRLRWTNYLRPDLKHNGFTLEEEELIINSHKAIGSRWSLIAKQLPGRTDNDVKNYWNTKLSKKLRKMGIDPVTHKPFSQVVSEYENISGLVSHNVSLNSTSTPNSHSLLHVHNNNFTKIPVQGGDHFSGENFTWKQLLGDHQEAMQPHLFSEVSYSCSSSSSTTIIRMNSPQTSLVQPFQSHTTQIPPFGWTNLSSVNPVPHETIMQNEESSVQISFPIDKAFGLAERQCVIRKESFNAQTVGSGATPEDYLKTCPEIPPSSVSSFVEAILDRDRQLRAEFPEILDGFLDY